MIKALKQVEWWKILLFYSIILLATFLARLLPNVLQLILSYFSDKYYPWNFNHGFAVLLVTFFFYKYSKRKTEFSLLGNQKYKSIIFPIILCAGYAYYGIPNDQGVNPHIWALLFCVFTLMYDLMEEYAWRGYLIENLGPLVWSAKAVISGVFWAVWHLLIFQNFDQFGGFWIFLLLCIVFSFLLTFSVIRTKSILVAATLHALMIRSNFVTLACLIIYLLRLFTWNKGLKILRNRSDA